MNTLTKATTTGTLRDIPDNRTNPLRVQESKEPTISILKYLRTHAIGCEIFARRMHDLPLSRSR